MFPELLLDLEIRLALGLRADAARLGLREAAARTLLALGPDEGVRMSELARRLGRDPSTATRFVDRAHVDGLLERTPGTVDRRRRVVVLTPKGIEARGALLAVRRKRVDLLAEAMLAETGLGEGQIEWFLTALVHGLSATGRSGSTPST